MQLKVVKVKKSLPDDKESCTHEPGLNAKNISRRGKVQKVQFSIFELGITIYPILEEESWFVGFA